MLASLCEEEAEADDGGGDGFGGTCGAEGDTGEKSKKD
jgi:hypothetical protein